MSTERPSAYVCGRCGLAIPGGARWCPRCHSTDVVFVEQEPDISRVIQVKAPTIIDDEAIWGSSKTSVDDRSLFERANPTLKEPLHRKATSRWAAGVNTFGPTGRILITTWVIGSFVAAIVMSEGFLLILLILLPLWAIGIWLILRDVWRKDEVAAAGATVMDGMREMREPKTGPVVAVPSQGVAWACENCGTHVAPGERWCPVCNGPASRVQLVMSPEIQQRVSVVETRGPKPLSPESAPSYTRWAKTPTTQGPAVKIALSLLVVTVVVCGYPVTMALSWTTLAAYFIELPEWTTSAWYLGFGVLLIAGFLAGVWRKGKVPPAEPPRRDQPEGLVHWVQPRRPWSENFTDPVFSRWSGGPASLEPTTKVLMTAGLVFFNVFLIPPMLWALTLPGAFVFLAQVWKKERAA